MTKILDLNTWNRKEHFEFFNSLDEPYYGITTEVDCTFANKRTKLDGTSFFLKYLHSALQAANLTKEFRYRIDKGSVVVFDKIHASPTVGREDGTFGYSFLPYHPDFNEFSLTAQNEIERVRRMEGLNLNEKELRLDVIHFSSLPWFHFSGLSHPRDFKRGDSVPKITFGKWVERMGRKLMPVSIHVHHGLIDGYHIGRFLEVFQEILNS